MSEEQDRAIARRIVGHYMRAGACWPATNPYTPKRIEELREHAYTDRADFFARYGAPDDVVGMSEVDLLALIGRELQL